METQRERLESYFNLPGAKYPEEQAITLAAADAYDSATARGQITAKELKTIVDAVSSKHARIWMNCYTLLYFAGEKWREAAEAIVGMSRDSKAHIRFNAICCLSCQTPQDVIDTVLKSGFGDRSASVRRKAADKANAIQQIHLVPDMEASLTTEKNEGAKKAIRFSLGFLRDGYNLESDSDGSHRIAVRLDNGGTGIHVTDEELRSRGIARIVAEVQKHYDQDKKGG